MKTSQLPYCEQILIGTNRRRQLWNNLAMQGISPKGLHHIAYDNRYKVHHLIERV